MKTLNHIFSTKKELDKFILNNNIDSKEEQFIQLFTGNNDPKSLKETLSQIKSSLPNSSIIATSTAGEISDGSLLDSSTVLSISTFESTKVNVALLDSESEDDYAEIISSNLITDKTKLIIIFNNLYANDGELLIKSLNEKIPHVTIAGGNAGDDGKFEHQTVVGVNDEVSTTAVAIAIFDSDTLHVSNDMLLNWQTIGNPMTVTKAKNNIVYEINHQKAKDIYKHYLGDDVAENLPISGIEFPLIFNIDGLDVARAPVALNKDGSLIMAGHIEEGTEVQFGFGDLHENDKRIINSVKQFSKNSIESIFIYSCSARKFFLNEHLKNEFTLLQKIAPTSGFITYGEFFKKSSSAFLLNVSSTFIGLSENSKQTKPLNLEEKNVQHSRRTLNALINLVKTTSNEIEEKNINLMQFKNVIKESTIYSATDTRGIIIDVNQKFIDISKYSKDELIGSSHNIVRHPNVPKSVYEDMWKTIQSKKPWTGIIKNRDKRGNNYFVRSNIFPIVDTQGVIQQYISIRDDITEEIKRQELMEGVVDNLEEKTQEKEYLLNQYENVINLNSAFFRTDKDNKIMYVNDVFSKQYGSTNENMVGKNIVDILEPSFSKKEYKNINKILIEENLWSGVIPFMDEDKNIIHMDTSITTLYDKKGVIAEHMFVLHDITDLMVAQKEIIDTQKDVVFTMGAIGETRSKETGNHVKRVAEYSRLLAVYYGLSEEESELLKMASPMHDIGKVGIPDAILNKPGKLTDDEWRVMKTHSKLGYQMLKNSKREILKAAAIVALTHHEKWDGSGYPSNTSGEHIHIYGRITAIADVFDALGSDRCYKKAWEDEKIFTLLKEESGKHFDPTLINIFFEHLDEFLAVRSKFQD